MEIFLRCGPAGVFKAIPELEFGETANLAAEAGHDQWTHLACADAEPLGAWSLIRPYGCKSALRKWHRRRSVRGCGAGAGRVDYAAVSGRLNFLSVSMATFLTHLGK